jgi:hypothetical protein
MFDRTNTRPLLGNPRQKLIALCLATAVAGTASAHPISRVDTANPADTSTIDPNGLEITDAVNGSVTVGTFDLALLSVWAAATVGLVGLALAADRRSKEPLQAARESVRNPSVAAAEADEMKAQRHP